MIPFPHDDRGVAFPRFDDGDSTSWSIGIQDYGSGDGVRVVLYLPECIDTGHGEPYSGSGIATVSLSALLDLFAREVMDESGFPSRKWLPDYLRTMATRLENAAIEHDAQREEMRVAMLRAKPPQEPQR